MRTSKLLQRAIAAQNATTGDNSCEASEVSKDFYNTISQDIKPYFRPPRGVANEEGEYIGSIVQIAKGGLGRLHGPALEIFTSSMLDLLLSMDERDEEAREENPLVIQYKGAEVKWDIRRYSSIQENGRWKSIPDYSIYFDCTQREMRAALRTEDAEVDTEGRTSRTPPPPPA